MCNMDEPQVLDFVKAVSDADRLRIIGFLAQHPAGIRDVADQLGMSFREAFGHLGMLEFAGVVYKEGDLFRLDEDAVQHLSKRQFFAPRPAYVPSPDLDPKGRKVLATFLNADGSLRQIPTPGARLQIVLHYLVAAFEPGVQYTEKEVNTVLRRFHSDHATLRRALVDAGLLARKSDGSMYWKIVGQEP
jgi:hypothetical protein